MNTTYNVTIIIDGAALREVSSAQRSWSGWMMVCQPIIDGAARSPSVLIDLSAINPSLMMLHHEKCVYTTTALQSTHHVHT